MSMLLQGVIALAVLAITAAVIPLLLQLRRTAAAMASFAESAGRDLNQVATDLHATRARVEALADLAQAQMEHPGPLGQVVFGLASALPAFLQPPKPGAPWSDLLVTGVHTILSLFRNAPQASAPEASHEP